MKKILRAIGMILLLLVIYLAASLVVGMIIGVVYMVSNIGEIMTAGGTLDYLAAAEEMAADLSTQTPLILLLSIAITLPFYYLIYRKRKQELRVFCSVRPVGPLNVLALIILALAVNIILELILSILSEISWFSRIFEQYGQVAEAITGGEFVISVIAIGIIAPIFEEILFRGLVFGELRKVSKIPLALVIQALLFGIYHMNVVQGSYAFLLGLLLGFVYYRSNSLIAPVIVHITINTSSLFLSEFITEAQYEQWGGTIVIASFILFVLMGIYILVSKGFRRAMDNSLYDNNRAAVQTAAGQDAYNQPSYSQTTYGQTPDAPQPYHQVPETHISGNQIPQAQIPCNEIPCAEEKEPEDHSGQ